MRLSSVLLLFTAGLVQASPHPSLNLAKKAELPAYFILTGDSTVATGGGWGDGLLSYRQNGAGGVNHGKNGATTVSFRDGGYWSKAIQAVKDNKSKYRPIVTIQFGHNDQKADKGISLAQFQTNLQNMAKEVMNAGGAPIIVTSLTRRGFKGNVVNENLADHSKAAIAAANAIGAGYIDLNRASTDYINAIGKTNAQYYDMESGDSTHLNAAGKIVFGRMVADLIGQTRTDLKTYLKDNKPLSDKIWAGKFATGDEK